MENKHTDLITFKNLPLRWRISIVIGYIFIIISIILIITIVILFKTDILYATMSEPDLKDYDYLFEDKDNSSYDDSENEEVVV